MSITLLFAFSLGLNPGVPSPAASKLTFERYQWDNVQIGGGGFVSGILFHPKQKDILYARTDIGGAYRWNPRSKRWIPLLDWIQRPDWNLYGVESIGLDPNDPKRLYLALGTYTNQWAGNGAILRSTDQGRTFLRTDLPFKLGGNQNGRSIGERLAVDPNAGHVLYFGSRDNGLWKSVDQGAIWTKQESFPIRERTNGIGICFEVFDKASGRPGRPTPVIYAGVSSREANLYRSIDAGQTWLPVPGQPSRMTPQHAAFDPAGALILTYGNAPGPNGVTGGAVWKLDPKNDAWTDISPQPGKSFGYAGLSLDAEHPGTMVVSTLDRWNPGDDVFRTIDGGVHWIGLKDGAKMDSTVSPFLNWGQKSPRFGWWIGSVQIDPFHPGRILYGTGATIWGSDDATNVDRREVTHWTPRAQGLEETAVIDLVSPPTGAHLFSGLGDIGGFRHDDLNVPVPGGMMQNPLHDNTDGIDFAELNPANMARVGRGGANVPPGAYSTDGGRSWKPLPSPRRNASSGHVAISADGAAIVWAAGGGAAYVTRDMGATWMQCKGALGSLRVVSDRVDSNVFYGFDSAKGALWVSKDAGRSFDVVSSGLPTGDARLRALPAHQGDLWLAAGKALYHSTDAGSTFQKLSGPTDVSTVGFGKAAPGQKYPALYLIGAVEGVEGAFRSDDAGRTWACITDAQHGYGTMDQIIGDPRIYGRVYIGTNGRGILYGDKR